jgi:hypothetical protein
MIDPIYKKQRPLLNENERSLYEQLKIAVGNDYLLVPQVHLEKLIAPKRWLGKMKYAVGHVSRWSVDFALFDVRTYEPLMAIELNGESHNFPKTIARDLEVSNHLKEAGIPLLTFYNHQPVTSEALRIAIHSAISVGPSK